VKIISSYLNQTLILPLKIGVNEFYGALQATNIKAYRTAQMAHCLLKNKRVAYNRILELSNILRKLALANIHAPEKLGNISQPNQCHLYSIFLIC
jgi:hypothetical protein